MSVYSPQPTERAYDGERAWRAALRNVLDVGAVVSPRGQATKELLGHSVSVNLARAVVTSPLRKLNYKFMCAEALWILDGQNELAPLTRFVARMAEFSDDGATLAGAYGPRLVPQLPYVVDTLARDRDTRQAVASIWMPTPTPSKDIPCTVAVCFNIRNDALHQQVFMRSSDLWLGLPYDMFSFSCWGIKVACLLNARGVSPRVKLGTLTVTAASSHLYERDWVAAYAVLIEPPATPIAPCPAPVVEGGSWVQLEADLLAQREGQAPVAPVYPWQVRP